MSQNDFNAEEETTFCAVLIQESHLIYLIQFEWFHYHIKSINLQIIETWYTFFYNSETFITPFVKVEMVKVASGNQKSSSFKLPLNSFL